jgi:hypothetical protein
MNSSQKVEMNLSWLTSSAPKLNSEACVRRVAFRSA